MALMQVFLPKPLQDPFLNTFRIFFCDSIIDFSRVSFKSLFQYSFGIHSQILAIEPSGILSGIHTGIVLKTSSGISSETPSEVSL